MMTCTPFKRAFISVYITNLISRNRLCYQFKMLANKDNHLYFCTSCHPYHFSNSLFYTVSHFLNEGIEQTTFTTFAKICKIGSGLKPRVLINSQSKKLKTTFRVR